MVYRNDDPKATANEPLGDEVGGNTDQPQQSSTSSGGMSTANAGALTGAAGLAKAKKATKS